MTLIHLLDVDFPSAAGLQSLLGRRRIAVRRSATLEAGGGAAAVLVASARAPQAQNGARALTEGARALQAKLLVIVEEEAPAFAIRPELGGRVLRVALPSGRPQPPLADAALMMLADLIGQNVQAMVAADPLTGNLIDLAARVARTDVTVFVNGPTGSGKEVLARFIHAQSRRAAKPFVAINCAAIPENMLEAMLFGHEKGAFTGASTANKGLIRAADGGTLLLDEISEMPMGLQSKLLRVLQERSVTPIGSAEEVPVDIRVIATSNRNMAEEIAARRFREDLFYRLNVFPLTTRALADRPDDIPALAVALIRRHTAEGEQPPMPLPEALAALSAHRWPGNVRELENVIQRAMVLREGQVIRAADIVVDAGESLMLPPLAAAV